MKCFRKILSGILLVCVFLLICSFKTRKKQVLVLHSYHQGLNWTDNVSRGILSVLNKNDNVEITFEYMDTKRHSEAEYLAEFAKLYNLKHQTSYFDVIIVCDNNALDFVSAYYQNYFDNIPIVFCGIDQFSTDLIEGLDNITGITEEIDSKKTIEIALQLHPKTKQLVVINDNQTRSAILNRNNVKNIWPDIDTDVKLVFLENLLIEELAYQVENLNPNSIIYLLNFSRDKDGNYISYQENIELIREATDLPIYSSWDFYFNEGIVGGMITSGSKQGELAAKSALKILSGTSASQIPIVRQGYNQFKFDFEQMKRFKILPKQLPNGSYISNQPPSIVKQYQTLLLAIAIFIIVIVFILRYTTIKRKRNERRLKKINEELDRRVVKRTQEIFIANEKLELQTNQIVKQNKELEHHRHNLLELVKERTENLEHANRELKSSRDRLLHMLDSNSDGVWEHNFKTGEIYISKIIWDKLGYHSIAEKNTRDILCKLIHPEDLIIIKQKDKQNRTGKSEMFVIEFRICSKDKTWMWFKAKGKILDYTEEGIPLNLVGTLIDINQRKVAEEKIREEEKKLRISEKRWRSLIEQASDEILIYN
ncbi:MAG: PAS domain-containing protein, partial [Marinifilum sp.]|nr:PAS domain-containing protein [Marinifilum sp.]